MRERFRDIKLRAKALQTVAQANQIIAEYKEQNLDLTLRQLYYQFVSLDLLPNTQQSYDRLGKIISDARLAGLIDWNAIVDRTRNLSSLGHWESPQDIIDSSAWSFRMDKWMGQAYRLEVWIEKEALVGVVSSICNQLDVPFFACRGYVSQSEQWNAGRRFQKHLAVEHEVYDKELKKYVWEEKDPQTPVVVHLGDHDPSGMDMTRDNWERLSMFSREDIKVRRIALNMDQIREYKPPPNPAKLTDSRAQGYISQYGYDSWELDALKPTVLRDLISNTVREYRDEEKYNEVVAKEREHKADLELLSREYPCAIEYLKRPRA